MCGNAEQKRKGAMKSMLIAFGLFVAMSANAMAQDWMDPVQPGRRVLVFVRYATDEEAKESREAIEATRWLDFKARKAAGINGGVEGIRVGRTNDCNVHIVDASRFPESARQWGCRAFPTLIVTQDNRPIAATVRFPEVGHYRWSFDGFEDDDVYFSALTLPYPKHSWQWSWPRR